MTPSTATATAQLCIALDRKVTEYAQLERDRAENEATYRAAKARRTLEARADGIKSIAEAEVVATADRNVTQLHRDYLVAEAISKAAQQAITALRVRIDFGRSQIATERAADTLHAGGYGGQP